MSISSTPDAAEIRRQMRDVRSELRDDVQEIVENAHDMTNWRCYVRRYPWPCLGAAAAVGYLLVPSRSQIIRPDSQTLSELVRQHQVAAKAEVQPQPPGGVLGKLVDVAAGALLQEIATIASQQLNDFLRGLATAASYHHAASYQAEQQHLEHQLRPLDDLLAYLRDYVRERPEVVALTCLAVVFVLGWKLKPW